MNKLPLALAAGTLAVAGMSTAHAPSQSYSDPGFYAAIGYYDVAPKGNNGVLAGTFKSDIGSDPEPAVTPGYKFNGNWSAEAWLPLIKFEYDVKLDGTRSATITHRPILLTAQYHYSR